MHRRHRPQDSTIPGRILMEAWQPHHFQCSECGEWKDERYETVWQAVRGWEKKRNQGGTNHVALRRPLPESMCNGCMTKLQAGVDARQESLWSSAV